MSNNKIEFEVVESWDKLPEGWSYVEVAGVTTDSRDRVFAFNRGDHPMIIFDSDGNFIEVTYNARGRFGLVSLDRPSLQKFIRVRG